MENAYYRDLLLAYQRKAKGILSLPTPEQQTACFTAYCKGHPEQTAALLSALARIDVETVSLKEGKETS